MKEAAQPVELAYYYPNPFWHRGDWIKSLILFFDGIALLVPTYMHDRIEQSDPAIVAGLREHGLLHVIEPESAVDQSATLALAESMTDIIVSGALDELAADATSFSELSMSRLGYAADEGLAHMIFEALRQRGLARDSADGVSIPMHPMVRSLILTLLAQIMRTKNPIANAELSPITDRPELVESLNELLNVKDCPARGHVIAFDLATVGIDLGPFPMDEILDFRTENQETYRRYVKSVRLFMPELSRMDPSERGIAFEDRQAKLDDLAADLQRTASKAWKKPCSLALGLTGAAWRLAHGDAIGAAIAGVGSLLGAEKAKTPDLEAFSYLFKAAQRF